ncbi:2'-5' RNA ligase family protein [Nocardioides mangrovi]|uniref:2'-5' RNA ligase family protein n=1 Tax=Nocardioides mangrovi TaxID=2874580 RepID=A0ABS7UCU6_9ACTN|nr:2'-5' RNA ligase family protein [Nocardioides mangrovi]MBZ5738820.1 2'-5' RNA ligase family protein [Nocardioides mangrovi]
MPRLHALELVPDDEGRDAVLRDWQALRDAGLPSMLDHTGPTNTPHVTVVSAAELPEDAVDVARARLGAMLPVRARAAGLLLLGGERLTVARAVDIADDVVRRVLAVRVQVPDHQHEGWLPHVTIARRLPRSEAQRVVDLLGHADVELRLTELRRWDPERGRVTTIAQARAGTASPPPA